MNKTLIGIVVLGLLSGCAGSGGGDVSGGTTGDSTPGDQTSGGGETGGGDTGGSTPPATEGNDATSSTGFAVAGDTVSDPNVVLTAVSPIILSTADGTYQLLQQVEGLANTADPTVKVITLDGLEVTLTQQPDGNFVGTNGTEQIILVEGQGSAGNEVSLSYLAYFDTTDPDTAFSQVGFVVAGFNTDPSEVAALTGTVTYTGATSLVMTRGDSNNSYGFGPATFVADFDDGSISGEMTVSENGSAPGFEISETTLTVNSAPITGNAFTTDMVISTAGLGIDSVDQSQLDGQFYGVDGAAVGGSYFATGTDDEGATTVLIQGGFVAD